MPSEDENQLAIQRDLVLRQAKVAHADLTVIKMALNENRPLEALYTVNNAIERLDEEIEAIEEIGETADEHPPDPIDTYRQQKDEMTDRQLLELEARIHDEQNRRESRERRANQDDEGGDGDG